MIITITVTLNITLIYLTSLFMCEKLLPNIHISTTILIVKLPDLSFERNADMIFIKQLVFYDCSLAKSVKHKTHSRLI